MEMISEAFSLVRVTKEDGDAVWVRSSEKHADEPFFRRTDV